MGCRAQVHIKDTNVYLYTHWNGNTLADVVRRAIIRGYERSDDPEYLARIIFCEMVKGDIDGTTGYGIGTTPNADNEWLIEVSCRNQTVVIIEMVAVRCPIRDKFVQVPYYEYRRSFEAIAQGFPEELAI
jgi:hypothetical protein